MNWRTEEDIRMGTIVVSDNVSLDGVFQDPAGDEGFARGGWVGLIKDRPELAKLALDEALGAEAMLMGRRTYEWFAARWPSRSGALADRLNSMPKYVVSSTLVRSGLEQLDGRQGRAAERGLEAESGTHRGDRRPGQLRDRPRADGARSRRRAAAEDLSGRARRRRATVRRDRWHEAPCASSTSGPSTETRRT